jgi:hypothetical protein
MSTHVTLIPSYPLGERGTCENGRVAQVAAATSGVGVILAVTAQTFACSSGPKICWRTPRRWRPWYVVSGLSSGASSAR